MTTGQTVPGAAAGPTDKTVVINWVEECHHEMAVRVPLDFDPDACDLENGLAELDPDGFSWLDRTEIEVEDAEEYDAQAQYFDPPRYDGYDDSPAAAAGEDSSGEVMIPGEAWSAFLEQEMQLDREHSGDVSLAGVIAEIRKLAAEHAQDAGTAE